MTLTSWRPQNVELRLCEATGSTFCALWPHNVDVRARDDPISTLYGPPGPRLQCPPSTLAGARDETAVVTASAPPQERPIISVNSTEI